MFTNQMTYTKALEPTALVSSVGLLCPCLIIFMILLLPGPYIFCRLFSIIISHINISHIVLPAEYTEIGHMLALRSRNKSCWVF